MSSAARSTPKSREPEESPLRTVLLLITWTLGMVVAVGVFAFACYVLIQ